MRGAFYIYAFIIYPINYAQALGSLRLKSLLKNRNNPELVGGSSHPCYRECMVGESLSCNYTFTLTQYTSMSYACRDCPMKNEDCFREGCVTAGGHVRPITVANHMLPGPSVQVCEGDTIRVKVVNAFASDSATIHWHGIHQVDTPFMDGTPFVTQCPIPPHNTFEYVFKASPAGTHIWHSHIGRSLRACETLWSAREIAPVALSAERKRQAENVFHITLRRCEIPPPVTKTVLHAVLRPQSADAKANCLSLENRQTQGRTIFFLLGGLRSPNGFEEADGLYGSLIVRKSEDPVGRYYDYDLAEHVMIIWHWYDASTAFRLATALHTNSAVSGYGLLINGLASMAKISSNNTFYTTPRKMFEVETGKRYRFRTIFNSAVYCPVQISIDDHTLIVIASESGTFDPIEVESFIINGGERYDFVLSADKEPSNYWIRYRGLGDCESNVRVSEVAVLKYKGSKDEEPSGTTNYDDANRSGVLLNPVQSGTNDYSNNAVVKIVELNDTTPNRINITGTPDHTFYFKFSFNAYDSYYAPGPYPQINDISFEYPAFPLLTEGSELTSDMYCTESNDTSKECVDGFCSCPVIYRAAKDSLVEVVFVDTSMNRDQDHPMHLHGYDFHVVSMETVGDEISLEAIKNRNEAKTIQKKLIAAPVKDNIGVPARGFTIVRFIATNPGYWFFHCHIANHAEMGMGVVLKVGEDDEMIRPPSNFPKCGRHGLATNVCPPRSASMIARSGAQLSFLASLSSLLLFSGCYY